MQTSDESTRLGKKITEIEESYMKDLMALGIDLNESERNIYFNSPVNLLVEKSVAMGHGHLSKEGALVVKTGKHTGRSAGDKYVVKTKNTADNIWWENSLGEMTPETFDKLTKRVVDYLNDKESLFITERCVGAHEKHQVGVKLVSSHPSHSLFSKYLFRDKIKDLGDDFIILHAPELKPDPSEFGTKSETIITTCFDKKITIITGSLYAGEIKKSMFCVMNYILPEKEILPMHSGANRMENGDVSVFFGLSGTGKTTLSTDEGTYLIGDDEHGMSDEGVFNFEGGCYAKTYKLSADTEPGIYAASNRFGSLLENVVLDEVSGQVDFFDKSIAENGRSSYPLTFIDGLEKSSKGKIPNHIFFLTADAFGVLPPVSKLDKKQAMFYFVLGYTAKLAGTEVGIQEPQATFSACFGAPFMLRHPSVYAKLLGEYLDRHETNVWLINTGWIGGKYGIGHRCPLHMTRKIIRRIQAGELEHTETNKDPVFNLSIPIEVEDIPSSVLRPEQGWSDPEEYKKSAQELAASFHKQMKKFGDFYHENIQGAPTYIG